MGFFAILHRVFWHKVRCFFGACIENVVGPLCRQDAGTLFLVRILVLGEVLDLDDFDAVDLVADDKPVLREVVQAGVYVQPVAGKEVNADLLGLVEQPAFAVGQRPEAGKEHADPDVAFAEFRVREEAGFDIARACHQSTPSASAITRTACSS